MMIQFSQVVFLFLMLGCQSDLSDQPEIHRLYETGDDHTFRDYVSDNPERINDVSESGDTVVMLAAYDQNNERLRFLVDTGADIDIANEVGTTPLAAACLRSDEDMVRYLLGHEPDPNAGSGTALQWAVTRNNINICRLLLEAGASPLLENGAGENAIEKAYRLGFNKIAE